MDILNSKKGQGLSLTVIIVAVLAIIVLVILTVVFMGRMAVFGDDVNESGSGDLMKLKIFYGDCHPSTSSESAFKNAYASAANMEDSVARQAAEDEAYDNLDSEISRCKSIGVDQTNCESTGCSWN
jgi:hypothetical protein